MLLAVVLLCASLASGQFLPPSLSTIVPQIESTAQGGISMGNSAAQLGGRLTSQGSTVIKDTAKQIAAAIAALKSTALKGGVDVFKQAMDIGGRVTANIPVVGTAVGMGTNALKTGADLVNNIGQNAINTTQNLMNIKLGVIDGVVQAGAGAFMNAANASATVASKGVQSAANAVTAAVSSGSAALDAAAREAGIPFMSARPSSSRPPFIFNPDVDLFYTR